VQNVILLTETSVVNYKNHYEEKGPEIDVALNTTIILKFIRRTIDMHGN